jgi:hypothetical protein
VGGKEHEAHDAPTIKNRAGGCPGCDEHKGLCEVMHSLHNRLVKLEGRVDTMERPAPKRHPE